MFCYKCGIELPETAIVCYKCATPTPKGGLSNSAQSNNQNTAKAILKFSVIGLAVIIGVGLAVLAANNFSAIKNVLSTTRNEETVSQTTTYSSPETEQPRRQPKTKINLSQPDRNENQPVSQKETVIDQTFFVGARNYQEFPIRLNRDAKLTGKFTAQGGKNDIDCIVVDDDNFINFQNQTDFRVYYQSNYVSVGRVDLRLAAGNYHIVFNNRVALLTNKTVTAKFEVE